MMQEVCIQYLFSSQTIEAICCWRAEQWVILPAVLCYQIKDSNMPTAVFDIATAT